MRQHSYPHINLERIAEAIFNHGVSMNCSIAKGWTVLSVISRGRLCKQDNKTTLQPSLLIDQHNRHDKNLMSRLPRRAVISPFIAFMIIITLILLTNIQVTLQQEHLCPNVCTCDNNNLETLCHGTFAASGIPHTLHPKTKRLTINYAQLTSLSGLDSIPELESLDLASNKIPAIDFDQIQSNTNLVSLNASHNNIYELRDTTVISALNKLDLGISNQLILTTKYEVDSLKPLWKVRINVAELVISHNYLSILKNYTFMRWAKLRHLDISYNAIVSMEGDSLFGLTRLEHINLRGNRLTQVPHQAFLSTTKSLNYIGSSGDDSISQLRTLDLSENDLTLIENHSFKSLGHLQELYLDSCLLQSIEELAFDNLANLHLLSVNHNPLLEIPTNPLSHLRSLSLLWMGSNKFKQIRSNSFKNLYNLEELKLNNGTIQEIQNQAFSDLISLKKLEIANNPNLTKVYPEIFHDLPRLNHMNLSAGSLASFHLEDGIKEHPLVTLDLRYNQLICDCQLKWFTLWLNHINGTIYRTNRTNPTINPKESIVSQAANQIQSSSFSLPPEYIYISCSGPPALKGKRIIDLPDNKLECISPDSSLNVRLGFASLFLMIFIFTSICLLNFCRNEKHLLGMLKENLVQNQLSLMLPYAQDSHENVDDLKKETRLDTAEYEQVDYGPIYTIPSDQYMLDESPQQQTYHM